jgi:hypothetical protein
MRRRLLVIAAAVGCGGDDRSDSPFACRLESTVPAFVGTAAVTDCGYLHGVDGDSPLSDFRAAHQCVLDALAAHTSFQVIFGEYGIDSGYDAAYVGLATASAFKLAAFELNYPKGGATASYRYSCQALTDLSECPERDSYRTLCFACDGDEETDRCAFPQFQ